ncbi:translation elongation factor Ts [Candidatus Dependentiae bacterium]|nr:translation elongation factor Ts [Candidatus Dependentiae bacterium]
MSLDLLKELREKTGIGMMDCKKALTEANNDIEKAIEILRKKGIAVAAKRADNATNCGSVASFISPDHTAACLVQMSCETDFSANTTDMKQFATNVAQTVVTAAKDFSPEELLEQPLANSNLSVKVVLEGLIAKIAESIKINRFAVCNSTKNGFVNSYIHPDNSIGVIASVESEKELSGDAKNTALQLVRDICMHAAVTNPVALDKTSLDPALLAKEREIAVEQLKASGKSEQIIEKIVDGKLAKYLEDVCLLNQKFIKNDKISIQQHIEAISKEVGSKLVVTKFTRFAIGR